MDENPEGSNIEEFVIDKSEYELVQSFLGFIRERQFGVFKATITTHKGKRWVNCDLTDKKHINLNTL